ncbi:Uncharacterised protein [Bordetella pertussis]|nr:Uncharacterised protein [Bordetella pertussis]CFT92441.1 Uncharacterised protein [Bordetella pertussis]CFU82158.1 Uncharacterised protein [Bordetella pertussis]CFV99755.1 Uncharacterised protein [Bordetella pertussis]CPL41713.1 Uncharacterised protein [Bordetella pertussis]
MSMRACTSPTLRWKATVRSYSSVGAAAYTDSSQSCMEACSLVLTNWSDRKKAALGSASMHS